MKRSPKVISLDYLQKLVKKQEEKDEKEKKFILYVDGATNEILQLGQKDN